LRVFPGAAREAQRLVFALLREAADIKGGSLIEIMPNDWLLTELPDPEAERLRKLLDENNINTDQEVPIKHTDSVC